jgi:hypothetical protein
MVPQAVSGFLPIFCHLLEVDLQALGELRIGVGAVATNPADSPMEIAWEIQRGWEICGL